MVFPLKPAGIANSLRYHHGMIKGLSCGVGRLRNLPPIGYVTPGSVRRFMPKYGSGYTLCLTSAATTVVGIVTVYHPLGWNWEVERTAPFCSTLHEDCSAHPSARESLASGCERRVFGCCANMKVEKRTSVTHNRLRFLMKGSFGGK